MKGSPVKPRGQLQMALPLTTSQRAPSPQGLGEQADCTDIVITIFLVQTWQQSSQESPDLLTPINVVSVYNCDDVAPGLLLER